MAESSMRSEQRQDGSLRHPPRFVTSNGQSPNLAFAAESATPIPLWRSDIMASLRKYEPVNLS